VIDKESAFFLVFGILIGVILEVIIMQGGRITELEVKFAQYMMCLNYQIIPCV